MSDKEIGSHFLTEITIEQFKCFTDFKADGFKRVNLIGGKNNVGKTAFLEACYINTHGTTINYLITAISHIFIMRNNLNLIDLQKKVAVDEWINGCFERLLCCKLVSNINNVLYEFQKEDAIKRFSFKVGEYSFPVVSDKVNFYDEINNNVNFVDSFGFSNAEVVEVYQSLQYHDKERELNEYIKNFDPLIESFKVIGDKPQCKTNGVYRELSEFGDGLNHYISIICSLFASKNGYLFIDEIGNGVHYTQLDQLWQLIFEISKATNCQVFAITHSKEMIDSFARVAKKQEEQDISYTTLVRNKENKIVAINQDYGMFGYSMTNHHEVR